VFCTASNGDRFLLLVQPTHTTKEWTGLEKVEMIFWKGASRVKKKGFIHEINPRYQKRRRGKSVFLEKGV
jgi:hypothetical protein